jgi:hypothetical protein
MYVEHQVPIDQAFANDKNKTNGYDDYPFLLYVAHKFGDNDIKQIWDNTPQMDSVQAFAAGLAGGAGGLKDLWPKFALATWNDSKNGVQQDLFDFDKLPFGVKAAMDKPGSDNPLQKPIIAAMQAGSNHRSFDLMATAQTFPSGIQRLSIHYDDVKFTDPGVHFVSYEPPVVSGGPATYLKIQAIVKKNGQWQEPEDWTDLGQKLGKSWCRDESDGHIDELVLFYTNSNPQRPSDAITFSTPPKIHISSVGCYHWVGTSHVQVTFPDGGTTDATSTVTFEVDHNFVGIPEFFPIRYFQPVSGTATIRGDNIKDGACTTTITMASTPLAHSDTAENGYFYINYTEPGISGPLGHALGQGQTDIPNVTQTMRCPDQDPITTTDIYPTNWMIFDLSLPLQGATVSDDGQSMTGSITSTDPDTGAKTVSEWTLQAEAQN